MYYTIRAIVFDFGKVLAEFDHMKTCEILTRFSNLNSLEIYKIIFQEELEKEYDSGKISSFDFFVAVGKKISASIMLSYDEFTKIWGDIFIPNTEIEELIASICPEIKKILLSNTNELHWEYIKKLEVIKEFFSDSDNLILSFKEHILKPEEGIFELAIRKTGCPANQILYINDKLEHINVFRGLGGHGILYNCIEESITSLRRKLKPFGVFI